MAFNPNLPRWLLANVNGHFASGMAAADPEIDVVREGQPLDVPDGNRIEIRMDGPFQAQYSKIEIIANIEVNIFVTTIIDDKNYLTHSVLVGQVTALFTSIPVYKCGDGPDDDGSLLGCLKLKTKGKDPFEARNFGQIAQQIRLNQSTVEGHYKIELTGD